MITDADRAKYALPPKPHKKPTLVDKANAAVDIRDILREMRIWTPPGEYYSYKIYCPWHDEHVDQNDKNCRIFGSTNIYCWAMHGYISPVYLYARWKHLPQEKAAIELLDQRGLLHKPWREKWNELLNERDEKMHRQLGSKNDFLAALTTALNAYPVYVQHEFHQKIRRLWQRILQMLDSLWENPDADLDLLNECFDVCLTALLKTAKIVDDHPEEN